MKQNKWYRLRAGNLPLTLKGRIARKTEKFIKRNGLYQFHYVTENGAKVERIDYYPAVDYMERKVDNEFLLRIRMDGTLRSERFRDMEQELADMFKTVCIGKCEERGYLIYHFERTKQEQKRIYSHTDIQIAGETEIVFSGIAWDWRKCPHLLLVGNTGSGKTQTAQYIISCLLNQGVRVIYCDPKNDDDMRLFMQVNPSVRYVTKENEIAKAVIESV